MKRFKGSDARYIEQFVSFVFKKAIRVIRAIRVSKRLKRLKGLKRFKGLKG